MITEVVENSRHMHHLQWEFISRSGRAPERWRRATPGWLSCGTPLPPQAWACRLTGGKGSPRLCSTSQPPLRPAQMFYGPVSTSTRRRVRISADRRPIVRESDATGGGAGAAFDGMVPGKTPGLGAMAASWHPWHTRCSDASANGEDHASRRRSNTHVLHSVYRPCRPGQTVLVD
jgi:hypothetical protein